MILLRNIVLNQQIDLKINRKTIGVIRQWIYQSIYHHILGETLVYNFWKILSELFESKDFLEQSIPYHEASKLEI